jgi:carboxymethylenebutenolidase
VPGQQITAGGATVEVYLARPATPDSAPGVVVLHDIAGLGTDVRAQADWLAGEGFLAAAPDLFDGGTLLRCLRSTLRDYTTRGGRTFDLIEATRTWLSGHPDCTGSVAILGFCLGGDFALLLTPSGGYQAAAINYARVPTDADTLLAGSCPVVASYGARDRPLRGAADRLEHALTDAGVPHDVTEYPDAGHAFLNQHPPGELPLLLAPLGLLNRAGYHEPAARDARARITAFLHTHLQS